MHVYSLIEREKKICILLWIKLEAFLSGSFYQCACISNQPTEGGWRGTEQLLPDADLTE